MERHHFSSDTDDPVVARLYEPRDDLPLVGVFGAYLDETADVQNATESSVGRFRTPKRSSTARLETDYIWYETLVTIEYTDRVT